jgi:hypothetical protein
VTVTGAVRFDLSFTLSSERMGHWTSRQNSSMTPPSGAGGDKDYGKTCRNLDEEFDRELVRMEQGTRQVLATT